MSENLVAAPDGALWYTDQGGNRLMRIGTDFRTSAVIPVDAQTVRLSGLAVGPQGQLWYSKDSGRIGHIPLDGGDGAELVIPDTRIPATSSIVLGGDANLWFFDPVQNFVGRMTPQGALTQFDPHKGSFRPKGIAAAPDGGIWVTVEDNALYRIDPTSGAFRRFDINSPNSQAARLVVGSDGTVWFTMPAAHKIGRLSPAGVMSEFDSGGIASRFIAMGPDGAVWFTGGGSSGLGRLDPSTGNVERIRCESDLYAMAIGKDARLYVIGNGRLYAVVDPMTPVQASVVASAALPVSPAGPSVEIVRADRLADRIAHVPGRAVVQFTSNDSECVYCVPANPRFDAIARRRAASGWVFLRVLYAPWPTAADSVAFNRTSLGGLPGIASYEGGTLVGVLPGNVDAAAIDAFLDKMPPPR